jgi:folate-dependent phosphoribosylglycinamide formyltransferase PurN
MSLLTVFDGRARVGPMRVAVLFSGSASSMKAMLEDQVYGVEYEIVGALTDRAGASGIGLAKEHGIPVEIREYMDFLETNEAKKLKASGVDAWTLREHYDRGIAGFIKERFNPDVIALSGWMRILSDPFLETFPYRCLNVHPADLSIRYRGGRRDGQRCFTGDDAVTDALIAGETELRSTIHFLNSTVDGGPIFVQSGPYAVDGAEVIRIRRREGLDALASFARDVVQEAMKHACDGPAFTTAMHILATRLVQVDDETEVVYIDGEPLPYSGHRP